MTAPQTTRVTQADREAAKSLLGRDDAGPSWWSIDSGNADNDPMVQAFARHRQAAEAEAGAREAALREALEDCLSTLEHTRAFMLQKHGTTNPAREQAMSKARALLTTPASEGASDA